MFRKDFAKVRDNRNCQSDNQRRNEQVSDPKLLSIVQRNSQRIGSVNF